MRLRHCFTFIMFFVAGLTATVAVAADPTRTSYTASQCEGSYMPYPAIANYLAVPDSLEPVMINHVGRHGARFPSSSKNITKLSDALEAAASAGTITPAGKRMQQICRTISDRTAGRWGALDSLGEAEQRGIAARMFRNFPSLFEQGRVEAISSYSPRCIMSMYFFTHQLARLNNKLEITTSSGRQNSRLLRPFDTDEYYKEFRQSDKWKTPLEQLEQTLISDAPLKRILGNGAEFSSADEMRLLALAEYAVVACGAAMGIDTSWKTFFTVEEYNRLWACTNLRHYLQYSASTLTTATSEMAAPLLRNLIETTDNAAEGTGDATVLLRFGHAETLMPLMALMHLPGCYYMTNYFDTVALHWRDFQIVPMAANLQMILLRHKSSGKLYLRVDLNETAVPLIPGRSQIYTPWTAAREYLTRCLPIYAQ